MYLLTTWCLDCCGEDFEGCFDGSAEDEVFESVEAARADTQRWRRHGVPWAYRILEILPDNKFRLIEESATLLDGKQIMHAHACRFCGDSYDCDCDEPDRDDADCGGCKGPNRRIAKSVNLNKMLGCRPKLDSEDD